MTTRSVTDLDIQAPAVTRLAPEEAAAFAPELDAWLRPGADVACADELPLLLGPDATSTRVVVRENETIVSHAALAVYGYRARGQELRVGVIGGVATHPNARRRGHADRLIDHLKDRAKAKAVDAVVLWDETPGGSLYERKGFVRAGREALHVAWRDVMEHLVRPGWVRPYHPRDLNDLIALHDEEPAATVRDRATWKQLLQVPRADTYVLDRDNTIEAYGVVGKGIDLQGCLHEWGGEPYALPALVSGIFALRPQEERLTVMSPPWHEAAHRGLEFHDLQRSDGILGMVWIPNPVDLAQRLGLALPKEDATAILCEQIPLYLKGLDSM